MLVDDRGGGRRDLDRTPGRVERVEGHGGVEHVEALGHAGHEVHLLDHVDEVARHDEVHLDAAHQHRRHRQALLATVLDPAHDGAEQLQLREVALEITDIDW